MFGALCRFYNTNSTQPLKQQMAALWLMLEQPEGLKE